MNLDWLKTGIGPLKDLLTFLNKESKTSDVMKKQLIRELRDNLNIFNNAYKNNNSPDVMIDLLSNEAIKEAIKNNFKFRKLKAGNIEPYHVYDDRNKKYIGWDAEKLIDKIDEKIEELKIIKRMNGNSVAKVRNNISLMLSNIYGDEPGKYYQRCDWNNDVDCHKWRMVVELRQRYPIKKIIKATLIANMLSYLAGSAILYSISFHTNV